MIAPNYIYRAKVRRVVDGDTVDVDIDLGFRTWIKGLRLRLHGLDAPEVRGDERDAGIVSKAFLVDLIGDREVVVETFKDRTGKYGRMIAIIHLEREHKGLLNVNEHMVAEGYAVASTG